MATMRNIDPEVSQARSKVAVAVLMRDHEAEQKHRRELNEAKILAAAKAVAARLPELTPEQLDRARAILFGGAA